MDERRDGPRWLCDDDDDDDTATMKTECNEKTGAITLSRMNFSGYVGHVTIYLVECLLLHAV